MPSRFQVGHLFKTSRACSTYLSESSPEKMKQVLTDLLKSRKNAIYSRMRCRKPVSPTAVFVNNDVGLKYIDAYGFDVDYTLCEYHDTHQKLAFEMNLNNLVQNYGYPEEIKRMQCPDQFFMKGLHFDLKTGFTLKLDAFSRMSLSTVFSGYTKLQDSVIFQNYSDTHVPHSFLNIGNRKSRLWLAVDQYSTPVIAAVTSLVEFFNHRKLSIDPMNLFQDSYNSQVDIYHKYNDLKDEILSNIPKYFKRNHNSEEYIKSLVRNGKKVFLLTNNQYRYIDKGLQFQLGKNWRDLFDIIIVNASKPDFYQSDQTPFREVAIDSGTFRWERVEQFKKGHVYSNGNIRQFNMLTNWNPMNVIYFGDHLRCDLADLTLRNGWRTGAVIKELFDEIEWENNDEFQRNVQWVRELEHLVTEFLLHERTPKHDELYNIIINERKRALNSVKSSYRNQLGSIFKCNGAQSYFMKLLATYSDIYTSSIGNMLQYPLDMTFYSQRSTLPHDSLDRRY